MSIDRASEEFKARAQALVDKERDTIDEYGFTARHVFGQGSPGFSYTMGVSRIEGAPEVIAFGLPAEVAHALCWSFFEKVKTGWVPKDWEVSDEMANMPVTFRYLTDEAIEEHAHGTVLHADLDERPHPRVVAMVWPDPAGKFPWEDEFEQRMIRAQPDVWVRGS